MPSSTTPKQVLLEFHRHLADFIETQRALVRGDLAGMSLGACAGEGPVGIAEQTGADEIARNGAAVDWDRRGHPPRCRRCAGARAKSSLPTPRSPLPDGTGASLSAMSAPLDRVADRGTFRQDFVEVHDPFDVPKLEAEADDDVVRCRCRTNAELLALILHDLGAGVR